MSKEEISDYTIADNTVPVDTSNEGETEADTSGSNLTEPFDNLRHLRKYLADNPTKDVDAILAICTHIPREFYVPKRNVEVVHTLLSNVVQCFDEQRLDAFRYRRCNVLLGMKNTGKSHLVQTLAQSIGTQYPQSIVIFLHANQLKQKTIGEQVKIACDAKQIQGLENLPLQAILKILHQQQHSLLVIVDEAQTIYPERNNDWSEVERQRRMDRTEGLVDELCLLAEQPGCACWLTGSSQALYSLYSEGSHPDYFGKYNNLNNKKYSTLHYLALRDRESVVELHRVVAEDINDQQADEKYKRFGGAMGDLLQQQGLKEEFVSRWEWDSTAQAFLLRLVLEQDSNEGHPWNLRSISSKDAKEIIVKGTSALLPAHELQRMCDLYLLERDNHEQYHIAYPDAIRYCSVVNAPSSTERYVLARTSLEHDDIAGFLSVALHGMNNVPTYASSMIRKFENYPHSILHVLLWICHPNGMRFDSEPSSQSGRSDIVLVNQYRHYLELKSEGSPHTPEQACEQIKARHFHIGFPRQEIDKKKPAFFYGVKWTDRSTAVTLWVDGDAAAVKTALWKKKWALSVGKNIKIPLANI